MDLEIRRVTPGVIFTLGQMLDSGDAWKTFMALIPSDPKNLNSDPKYTVEHIRLIEVASLKQHRSCSEIMLEEWGTSGKIRPTLDTMLSILIKAELFRAAEYVSVDVLHGTPPERPSKGPAARVNLEKSSHMPALPASVTEVPFATLESITNNFDDTPMTKCMKQDGSLYYVGHRIGSGAFGTVYYGELSGIKMAVKQLNTDDLGLIQQFKNEVTSLSELSHENLLPLIGYSFGPQVYCLVYEYMEHGSLLDKLASKTSPLTWKQRIGIAVGTCHGIEFLHNCLPEPIIHRDVKSANILLDENLVAKLGDFGLVKRLGSNKSSKVHTSTVFGTSAYMAPESFRGDVSVKMDVFSVGVVLLELLTGLPPYDEERDGCDLITYIEDKVDDSIECLLDEAAGVWDIDSAEKIWKLSQNCLEDKKKRPYITNVLQQLQQIYNNIV